MRAFFARTFSALALFAALPGCTDDGPCPAPAKAVPPENITQSVLTPAGGKKTLVLYDTTGQWGALGELHAIQVANLVSHFGTHTAKPVSEYAPGELEQHDALVYIGSTYDEPLPDAFLTEVLATAKPVIWVYQNIWKLQAKLPTFAEQFGWRWTKFDTGVVKEVRYKGQALPRDTIPDNGVVSDYEITKPELVKVLAEGVRMDGTSLPWALRSRNFTYIGEIPLRYAMAHDRSAVFADLLFDALAPETPERHRAMVRIENVGPDSDPKKLREIADFMKSNNVPFSFAFYPRYLDPNHYYKNGLEICLQKSPEVVAAVNYLIAKGGTMVLSGLTHQYGTARNPYSGASGDDYEFYSASIDASNSVVLNGPVPQDSEAWAMNRLGSAVAEVKAMGLPTPVLFEFPRYAASVSAYRAATKYFGARYDRGLYFAGTLRGGAPDYLTRVSQSFPFEVTDVYGMRVIPENLGGYAPDKWFNEPPTLVPNIVEAARGNLVVRDGFASFFHQWYSPISVLGEIVQSLRTMGYIFVSPAEAAGVNPGAPATRTTAMPTERSTN